MNPFSQKLRGWRSIKFIWRRFGEVQKANILFKKKHSTHYHVFNTSVIIEIFDNKTLIK